jgi:hypothetical protein
MNKHEVQREEVRNLEHIRFVCRVPIKTMSEANDSQRKHWSQKHRRHEAQKDAVTWALRAAYMDANGPFNGMYSSATVRRVRGTALCPPIIFASTDPLIVTLTRVASRAMDDDDNLSASLKYVRDAVAMWLARDDGELGQIEWLYEEIKPTPKESVGVTITILYASREPPNFAGLETKDSGMVVVVRGAADGSRNGSWVWNGRLWTRQVSMRTNSNSQERDAMTKSSDRTKESRRKRCGTSGCKAFATHRADTGLNSGRMYFLLCDEHAATAKEPPLSATRLTKL